MSASWHVAIDSARAALNAGGEPWVQPLANGSMRCILYAPKQVDTQTPHTQDELYVITRDYGMIERDGQLAPVSTGDAIFVPAVMSHRFLDFSDDFECWALFWGPKGGEG